MPARLSSIPPDVAELIVRCHGVADIAAAERAGIDEGRPGIVLPAGWDR